MRLTQVMLFTSDVPRLCAFYMDLFGMAVVDGSAADGFVRLDAGGCRLALHRIRGAGGQQPEDRTAYPTKLCFHADDVRATRDALVSRGAKFGEIVEFDGIVLCDGADPDGNVIQLTTRA